MTTETDSTQEPTTPWDAARLYATLGYRVLPIGPGKKWPELPAWQQHATNDLTTINSWWGGIYRGHGVGLLMGHEGLFAIDIDVAHGHDGIETLKDLEDSYSPLPDTVCAQTPSGGAHFIYRAPPDVTIRNDAGRRLGPGIDIRGEGGQIVAAPTQREDGRAYVWVWGCAPWERPVADAPPWLIALLTTEDQWDTNSTSRKTKPVGSSPPAITDGALAHSSPKKMQSTAGATIEQRPGDRFNAATTWQQLLTNDGWTRTRNGPQGEQRWTRPGKSPKDGISATVNYAGTDLLKVFTSSIPGLEPDATYSRFGYWTATRHQGDHGAAARALAALEPRSSIDDLIGTFKESAPSNTDAEVKGTGDGLQTPGLFRWRLNWPAFWTREHLDENWHLAPILARGRGHTIWAGAKTGKSYHVLPMALAIATGGPHLDKPHSDPEHVLYLDYEMTEDDIHDRLTEFGYGPDTDLEHLHYISIPSIPGLDTAEGALYVIEAALHVNAAAVFIDTISRAVEGPENDADTIRAFYRHTGAALKGLGITWARLDHGGKDLTKGQRGTSAKNDDVDIVWKLARTDTGMRFEATHRRMSWVPDHVDVEVLEDDGVTRFRVPLTMAVPAGTHALVETLDHLGVPRDAGRDKARAALRKAGLTAPNAVLTAAVKARKPVRERHGQVDLSDLVDNCPDRTDRSTKPQVTERGQVDGQARTGTPSVGADRSVSLETDSPHADPSFDPFGGLFDTQEDLGQ